MNTNLTDLVTSFLSGDISENESLQLMKCIQEGDVTEEQISDWVKVSVEAGQYFQKRKTQRQRTRGMVVRIASCAVALAVVAVAGIVFFIPEEKTYSANASETFSVSLSDGTTVHLNNSSTLRVPRNFGKDNRIVTLEGEATFNVAKSKSPMIVRTGDFGEITVYGTVFNARSYPSDSKVEISLKNGLVSYKPDASLRPFTIEPGERIVFDRVTNYVDIDNADVDASFLWKEGETIFTDDSFKDIVSSIGRKYNINISYSLTDLSILGRKQSLTIYDFESLETVLNKISVAAGARYEISPDRENVTMFNL